MNLMNRHFLLVFLVGVIPPLAFAQTPEDVKIEVSFISSGGELTDIYTFWGERILLEKLKEVCEVTDGDAIPLEKLSLTLENSCGQLTINEEADPISPLDADLRCYPLATLKATVTCVVKNEGVSNA